MKFEEPKTGIQESKENLFYLIQQLNRNKLSKTDNLRIIAQTIDILTNVENSIEFYDNHPLYILLHKEFHKLLKGPIPVYAFEIRINLRPGNHVPARLDFNLYPQEPQPKESENFNQ